MSRTVIGCDIAIVAGALIGVEYDQRDRCTGRFALKDSGEDLYGIRFISLCREFRLTGLAPV